MKLKKMVALVLLASMATPAVSLPADAASKMTVWDEEKTLLEDMVIDGSLTINQGINLNGHTLTVKGDFVQNNEVLLGEGQLNVSGTYWSQNGKLDVRSGRLTVNGNFRIQNQTKDENNQYTDSTAWLEMDEENDYVLVKGSFFDQSIYGYGENYLTNGTLEVKGNFTQTGSNGNFNARGNHKTILSGNKKQTVVFSNPDSSGFNIVEITNPNVELSARVNHFASDSQVLSFVQYGMTHIDGTAFTVSGALIQKGDLQLDGGSLNVLGDYWQESGLLDVNHGTVTVDGNYIIQSKEQDENGNHINNRGYLQMDEEADYVLVKGDFYTQSDYGNGENYLTNGTLEVKGNFTQTGSDGNFNARENHKTILSGNKKQTVVFNNPDNSGFNQFESTNPEVELKATRINSITADSEVLSFDQYGGTHLNGHTLTVNGELDQHGNIILDGGKLAVVGDYWQESGLLDVNHGTVTVDGNYIIQSKEQDENGNHINSRGYLQMDEEADYVLVKGDFYTQSDYGNGENYLTNGTLEVKGNFTQTGSDGNFNARENHKTILSGNKKQTVVFNNPDNSGFNQFESTHPEVELKATRINSITADSEVLSFDQYGGTHLNGHTLTVNGELDQHGNIILDGGKLAVVGDYWQESGLLDVNHGTVTVDGNYIIQSKEQDENGNHINSRGYLQMDEEADYVLVKGDFYTQSDYGNGENYLTNGTLEVKGNFTQTGSDGNFNARENHKTILSGNKKQTVVFNNPDNSGFNQFESTHPEVELKATRINSITADSEVLSFDQYGGTHLNGHTLTVNGELDQHGNIILDGGKLAVVGDYWQESGLLDVNHGTVTVDGNYIIQSKEQDENGNHINNRGYLQMDEEADYVLVKGDFYTQSDYGNGENYLTNGTLEVKGNFTQTGSDGNFNARENHKTILSGYGVQKVTLKNADTVGFNELHLTKDRSTGYEFSPDPVRYSSIEDIPEILADFSIDSEKFIRGEGTASLTGSVKGGAGEYVFNYYYKKNTDSTWTKFNTTADMQSTAVFDPAEAGTYDIKAEVTDRLGAAKAQIFSVLVIEPLKNNSSVKSKIVILGNNIKMTAQASDGVAPYTYAFYIKKSSNSKWSKVGTEFGTDTTAEFKPSVAVPYDVKISVKDSDGTVVSKEFTVDVKEPPINNSTISASSITIGEKITLEGAAESGTTPYKYAFYTKKSSSTSWTKIGTEYGTATTVTHQPSVAVPYDYMVRVKDKNGAVVSKTFTVNVKKVLVNNSTINAETIVKGDKVTLSGAATGGTESFRYAFYYKKGDATKWTKIGTAFGESTEEQFTPAGINTYTFKVDVKDTDGTVASKEFVVKVNGPLVNNSAVSSEKIGIGDTVTMTAAAAGGIEGYTYAYYCKKSSSNKWTTIGSGFGTETTAEYKPATADNYDFKIEVKDSRGVIVSKTFTVIVKAPIVNNSTISAERITVGDTVTLTAEGTGGLAPYTYSYYVKKSSSTKWTKITAESDTAISAAYKPTAATVYDFRVDITDADGLVKSKGFVVQVKAPLKNNSTVTISDDGVTLNAAATGGTNEYAYAFYYKKSSSTKWSKVGTEFGTKSSATCQPTSTVSYDFRIDIKDTDGTVTSKTFTYNYKAKLSNHSSITLGDTVTLNAAATGGTAPYTYTYYYKKSASAKWTVITAENNAVTATCKPALSTSYDFRIDITDADGAVVSKVITATVN